MSKTTSIKIKITTESNLFIGGAPASFEIGGVDLYTVTDYEGYPYIPASSLKGALRAIVKGDHGNDAEKLKSLYKKYLEAEKEAYEQRKEEFEKQDHLLHAQKKYCDAICKVSAEYIFGIEVFNNTPKLLIGDFMLIDLKDSNKKEDLFSIDTKNTITEGAKGIEANPRTYKSVQTGVSFHGKIHLHRFERLGDGALELGLSYVKKCLEQFNDGVHRLGNSKSRGYGKIRIEIEDEGKTL
jgi:CRISPR-associated protein Csm3